MPTQVVKDRKKRIAWAEYNRATRGIPTDDPRYKVLENRAWRLLQTKLSELR